jgi:hypothetical protein
LQVGPNTFVVMQCFERDFWNTYGDRNSEPLHQGPRLLKRLSWTQKKQLILSHYGHLIMNIHIIGPNTKIEVDETRSTDIG